jgi:MFS family permease
VGRSRLIATRTVFALGVSQLVCWGISYYLVGVFGPLMVADLGWSPAAVYGGFSAGLLAMAACSPLTGRWLDRGGGAWVMTVGSVATALSCLMLALAHGLALYYAAWLVMGFAMRLTLYDAAFATLARIAGPEARRPIAQVTLLGGLASTVFWPLGGFLAEHYGWRGAVLIYGLIALATIPLHATLPRTRHGHAEGAPHAPAPTPAAADARERLARFLYALIVALVSFLNSGMSSHLIGVLVGLGLAVSTATWVGASRGIGQVASRLGEVTFGHGTHPLALNALAAVMLPLSFAAGFWGGNSIAAALAFALAYGAANGLSTITRGTLPLVLFDARAYGALVGRLLVPSFVLSAAAPLAYAEAIERFGAQGALWLSLVAAGVALAASLALSRLGRHH